MKLLFALLLVSIASPSLCSNTPNAFDIVKYGAKGDGQTDDSNAFLKAWQDACSSTEDTPTLIVPEGKIFMTQPFTFQGPCKSTTINVVINGNITAPESRENWKSDSNDHDSWITFNHISGLVVNGGGTLNAQGSSWWDKNEASDRPTALRFLGCDNLKHGPLTHLNSPRNHISITGCDDCVAINSGSKSINITNVNCGPGHGISVGSLGKDGEYATVEDIYVAHITFTRSTNGARIKTWNGGSGYARKITYENITLVEVKHSLIIDQKYTALKSAGGAVKISDVTFRNFHGTTTYNTAVELNCAQIGCTGIVLDDINIVGLNGEKPSSLCNNAQGSCSSCNPTVECLDN
ncbi:hypothetical protein TSUD_326510 [Trifolium subterraneum]|uniref:Pectate lyase superfamily protein domain-containing protein n=1 Tax=Trifolium subterraneum TaxID=3900 RepID=A0A2Z6NJG6_TRISU|nr:hypothetical protein TSUD_326510 [Trifolium subterraneum]